MSFSSSESTLTPQSHATMAIARLPLWTSLFLPSPVASLYDFSRLSCSYVLPCFSFILLFFSFSDLLSEAIPLRRCTAVRSWRSQRILKGLDILLDMKTDRHSLPFYDRTAALILWNQIEAIRPDNIMNYTIDLNSPQRCLLFFCEHRDEIIVLSRVIVFSKTFLFFPVQLFVVILTSLSADPSHIQTN